VTSIIVPDRSGKPDDVVLGFDRLEDYESEHPYFGCITGRCANRIAGGRFILDGKEIHLSQNAGIDHLHGGISGFDKKIWNAKEVTDKDGAGIELDYISPDGEEGYPGNLSVIVRFILTVNNELKINYFAESDSPTPINLTHHGYFNLKGAGNGDMLDHVLRIDADRYNVLNDKLLPTGELRDVTGTAMDFRQPKQIGRDIHRTGAGYDINYILNNSGRLEKVADVTENTSGRVMEVYTDQPGMQFYGGNFLENIRGKAGRVYQKHFGLCLETQHFPDAPNHPEFPDTILRPGQVFQSTTIYRFGIKD
jgi:aldose 1-epimerase